MSSTYAYGGDPTGLEGSYHYGDGGLGILGSDIASSGVHGAGYLYSSLSLPADANKEYYGVITSIPAGLTLDAGEDSGFTASGADGEYVVPFDVKEFGIHIGSSSFTITFGTPPSVVNLTAGSLVQNATLEPASVTVDPPVPSIVNLVASDLAQVGTLSTISVSVDPAPKNVDLIGAPLTGASSCTSGVVSIGIPVVSQFMSFTVSGVNRHFVV